MDFTFTVTVSVTRESGKFAGRDEIAEYLIDQITDADPGTIDGVGADSESVYSVDSFDVEEVVQPKTKRKG